MKTRNTKTYLHQEFMDTNQMALDSFSEGLQKKITIFGIMLPGLQDTIEEDAKTLDKKLDALDKEIYGDMLEEYEEYLENNELYDVEEQSKTKLTDPEILAELWKMGRKKSLRRSTLRDMGFKGELSKGSIRVGNYRLERTGIFIHSYDIIKNQ